MLHLSKSSWHYRLVHYIVHSWYGDDEPDLEEKYWHGLSLCKYFWTVVACVAILSWFTAILWTAEEIYKRVREWRMRRPRKPRDELAYKLRSYERKEKKILGYLTCIFYLNLGLSAMIAFAIVNLRLHQPGSDVIWFDVAVLIFIWGMTPAIHIGTSWADKRPRKEKPPKPEKTEKVKPYKPRKPKNPNIFWAYLKAKKGKFCPLIAWDD